MRFLIFTLFLSISCSQHRLIKPIQTLGPEWIPVQIKGAEQAWIIPQEGSSMLIDSHCKSKDQDIPLNALTAQLLIGMTNQTLIAQKPVSFQDREALVSTFLLKVDGALQKMHILVLKKEGCVFDVVLSTPESTFEKRLPDFEKIQQLFTLEKAKK